MKHVKPFRDIAEQLLSTLSDHDVNGVLERWIKLQQLWMSLESVFTAGIQKTKCWWYSNFLFILEHLISKM